MYICITRIYIDAVITTEDDKDVQGCNVMYKSSVVIYYSQSQSHNKLQVFLPNLQLFNQAKQPKPFLTIRDVSARSKFGGLMM